MGVISDALLICIARVARTSTGDVGRRLAAIGYIYKLPAPIGVSSPDRE